MLVEVLLVGVGLPANSTLKRSICRMGWTLLVSLKVGGTSVALVAIRYVTLEGPLWIVYLHVLRKRPKVVTGCATLSAGHNILPIGLVFSRLVRRRLVCAGSEAFGEVIVLLSSMINPLPDALEALAAGFAVEKTREIYLVARGPQACRK
jgi:hypothetical protein